MGKSGKNEFQSFRGWLIGGVEWEAEKVKESEGKWIVAGRFLL